MSDSRFNSQRDFIIDEEGYSRLNINTDAVMEILELSETILDCHITVEALKKNPKVVIIAVNQSEGDITFFHNIQELSEGIRLSFNSFVELQGQSNKATAA